MKRMVVRHAVSVRAVFMAACSLAASCSGSPKGNGARTSVVRGELDRSDWTLRDCSSDERIRVVMPSTTAHTFIQKEQELKLTESDEVVVQFEIAPIPASSGNPRAVGVMRIISVKRGNCGVNSSDDR